MYRVQKKRRINGWLVLLLFAGAFAVGLGLGYGAIKLNLWNPKPQTELIEDARAPSQEASEPPEPGIAASTSTLAPDPSTTSRELYFVGVQNGSVCAFTVDEKGEKRFSHKMAIDLDSLRSEDQKLLTEGVYLHSKQELLEFTEDFSS